VPELKAVASPVFTRWRGGLDFFKGLGNKINSKPVAPLSALRALSTQAKGFENG